MSKITRFDKPNLRVLRDEIDAALKPVADKYGISLKAGNASFDAQTVRFKLQGAVISDDGVIKDEYRVALERYYPQYVDVEVTLSRAGKAKVVGYNSRGRKYPFIAETPRGERYKVTEMQVRFASGA